MTTELTADRSNDRYGPLSFTVTMMHILVVDLTIWIFMPYSIVMVLPVVLVYMALSVVIARRPGKLGQVGRGMLLGSLSGPLSLILFAAVWAIAHAIGPI
jgi:hypothetical protein